jgi:hypothetical protein
MGLKVDSDNVETIIAGSANKENGQLKLDPGETFLAIDRACQLL